MLSDVRCRAFELCTPRGLTWVPVGAQYPDCHQMTIQIHPNRRVSEKVKFENFQVPPLPERKIQQFRGFLFFLVRKWVESLPCNVSCCDTSDCIHPNVHHLSGSKQHPLSAEALHSRARTTTSTESVGSEPFSRISDDTAISSDLCHSAQTVPEVFRETNREGEPAASHPPTLDTTWQVWLNTNGATDTEFGDVTKFATFSDLDRFSTLWRQLLAQAQALCSRLGIFRQGVCVPRCVPSQKRPD